MYWGWGVQPLGERGSVCIGGGGCYPGPWAIYNL